MTEQNYRDLYAAVERTQGELRRRAAVHKRTGTWSDRDVATGYEGAAALLTAILVDFDPVRMRGEPP